jgi:hypothetical protein
MAHFLKLTYELGRMYHNRPLEVKPGISARFLPVRLACAISHRARVFLEGADRGSLECEKNGNRQGGAYGRNRPNPRRQQRTKCEPQKAEGIRTKVQIFGYRGSQASLQHQGNFQPSPRSRDPLATCAGTEGYVPSLLFDCCTSKHALPSVTHT